MMKMISTSPPTSEQDWPATSLDHLAPLDDLPHLAIWRIPLDANLSLDAILGARDRSPLSDDDIARARRYVRASHGALWAQARAATRVILSHYAQVPPRALTFEISLRGKPSLAKEVHAPHHIAFNLSHSGAMALLGVCVTGTHLLPVKLGVDTEQVSSTRDLQSIARRVFSKAELVALREAADEEEQRARFYALWTQKEAYIKAIGEGMHLPLESFDVSHDLRRAALLAARHDGASPPSSWSMLGGWLGEPDYPFALCINLPLEDLTISLHSCCDP